MKKRLLSLSLALCMIFALFSLSSCGEKKPTLVVCNWGEYISDGEDDSLDVIKEFEKRYNVEVDYVVADTNESLYSQLKSGSGDYDVIFPSDYMIEKLLREDMLAELDFSNIPNFEANIMDEFKNPDYDPENRYTVPYFWGTVGILYNTELYGREVSGWSDLWSEGYENQILMMDNPRDAFTIALFELGYSINTEEEAHWREATELLKQKKFVYCMDEIFTKMPDESAAIGPYYAGDCLMMMEENENLAFFRPEYTNIFNDAMCIPKSSDNKELAETFINFMLEAEIGLANTEYVGYSTPNKAVYALLDEETKQNEFAYPAVSDKWEHMRLLSAETEALMSDLWVEVKASNK